MGDALNREAAGQRPAPGGEARGGIGPGVAAREYGLDWLRVFAFTVLILYHSGMIFATWPFHIKNAEQSQALELVMVFVNRWRLPLLFFVSGAAVCFSLRRRSYRAFARERLRRLLIPVLFGIFVIVPPQIYFERLQQGARFSSYWEFYPAVFQFVPYPQGATSWHHLWFVVYILVYSLLGIPLFAFLRAAPGRGAVEALARGFERLPAAIYLANLPSLAVGILLGPRWPTTHNLVADWANFTGSLITFLWGFVFASNGRLLELITRRRREFLFVGLAAAAIFYGLAATGATRPWPPAMRLVADNLVSGYFGMAWVFALTGYARAGFSRDSAELRYANEAVYPFYIVHQTILIFIGYYVIQWPLGLWPKLAAVAAGTFAGSWLAYEAVRRVRPLRPLFGLKPARV